MTPEAFEQLDELLSPETSPTASLTEAQRQAICSVFESAADEDELFRLASRVQAALDQEGGNLRGLYAAAVYQELIGEQEAAGRGFLELGRALKEQGDWHGVRELMLRALPSWPDNRVVRLLLDSWHHVPEDGAIDDDLALVQSWVPESPDLLWYETGLADEQGRQDDAARLACETLSQFVQARDAGRAEEPLLRVLESDDPVVYRDLIRVIGRMARPSLADLLDTTLELVEGKIAALSLSGELAKALERILLRRRNFEHIRPAYVRALVQSLGGTDEVDAFVRDCGVANPETPLPEALAHLRQMFGLRPGAYVEHHNFGVGRIVGHEGNFLSIDFADKPKHRMAMEIAGRSLRPLSSSCLRVARFAEPERIQQEIAQDPVALLVRALTDLGGEARVRDLRECLAGGAIAQERWTAWWKGAREAALQDDRLDTSQTFRQVYRLPGEDDDDGVQLPSLPTKGDAASAIRLINRLLKHQPHLAQRAKEEYGEELVRRVRAADAARALPAVPQLISWFPERTAEWTELANKAFKHEPGVAGGVTAEEQEELLRIGLEGEAWRDAAFSSLASRFLAIRRRSLAALKERLGEEFVSAAAEIMRAWDRPNTQLAIIRLGLAGALQEAAFSPVELLIHALRLIANNPPQKTRQAAVDLIDPYDKLGSLIGETTLEEEDTDRIRRAARELAASDTGIEPLVFLLSHTGHTEFAGTLVREAGPGALDPIAMHSDPSVTLMTRATYEQNSNKIEELQHQLAVELPRAIAHARSFGDLSENAEYHDAKDRQGIADANLRALQSVMENAQIIEDIDFPHDRVTVGTEVMVRDLASNAERTFWLLGQGDSAQDPNVINYLAPVGQALVGKMAGDVVQFEANGDTQSLEVISLTSKLP